MARVIRACPFLSLPSSASSKLSDFRFFHNSPRPPAQGPRPYMTCGRGRIVPRFPLLAVLNRAVLLVSSLIVTVWVPLSKKRPWRGV